MSAVWASPQRLEDCAEGFRASGRAIASDERVPGIHQAPEVAAALARLSQAERAASSGYTQAMTEVGEFLRALATGVVQADR